MTVMLEPCATLLGCDPMQHGSWTFPHTPAEWQCLAYWHWDSTDLDDYDEARGAYQGILFLIPWAH